MLDVQELIRNDQPIYVKNCTGNFLEKQGPYVLEIRDGDKRAAKVIIPATKYPFLLSGHVPPKLLANSTEFYAALSKGILTLVDPDEARRTMSDPLAQDVVNAALSKFQPSKRESKPPPELVQGNNRDNRTPPGADKGISGVPEERRSSTPLKVANANDVDEPSAVIEQIVMDLDSDASLSQQKFNDLAGMEGLSKVDLGYLMAKCKSFPKIQQWARSEMAAKAGQEAVEELEAEQEIDDIEKDLPPTKRRRRRRKK